MLTPRSEKIKPIKKEIRKNLYHEDISTDGLKLFVIDGEEVYVDEDGMGYPKFSKFFKWSYEVGDVDGVGNAAEALDRVIHNFTYINRGVGGYYGLSKDLAEYIFLNFIGSRYCEKQGIDRTEWVSGIRSEIVRIDTENDFPDYCFEKKKFVFYSRNSNINSIEKRLFSLGYYYQFQRAELRALITDEVIEFCNNTSPEVKVYIKEIFRESEALKIAAISTLYRYVDAEAIAYVAKHNETAIVTGWADYNAYLDFKLRFLGGENVVSIAKDIGISKGLAYKYANYIKQQK